jgi:hypothetical protein
MKKLVLTMVALVAMATTSFAQYFTVYTPVNSYSGDYSPRYYTPDYSYLNQSVSNYTPSKTIDFSSSVNYNSTFVDSYTRSDGTFVQSHYKSMPNDTNWDNYSTIGNINPFTGTEGHRAKDYSAEALNYGKGHVIYQGEKGGQYYYNSTGLKTYVPKRHMK